jgi:hypothetical protein
VLRPYSRRRDGNELAESTTSQYGRTDITSLSPTATRPTTRSTRFAADHHVGIRNAPAGGPFPPIAASCYQQGRRLLPTPWRAARADLTSTFQRPWFHEASLANWRLRALIGSWHPLLPIICEVQGSTVVQGCRGTSSGYQSDISHRICGRYGRSTDLHLSLLGPSRMRSMTGRLAECRRVWRARRRWAGCGEEMSGGGGRWSSWHAA